MRSFVLGAALTAACVGLVSRPAAAVIVTHMFSEQYAAGHDGSSAVTSYTSDGNIFTLPSSPVTGTITRTNGTQGTSAYGTGTLSFGWSDSLLQVSVDQTRGGAKTSYGYGFKSIEFTVNEDTPYTITGSYTVTDTNGDPGDAYMDVYLRDQSLGQYVSRTLNKSQQSPNELFTVGSTGGDQGFDQLIGSTTGTLLAGRTYKFYVETFTQSNPDADSGGHGEGTFNLIIGSVPSPDCGLAGLAVVAATAAKRPRRRA